MGNQRSTFCDTTCGGKTMWDEVSSDILENSRATIQEIVKGTKQPLDYCTAVHNCLQKAQANELHFRRAIQQIQQFKEEHPKQFQEKLTKDENKLDFTYTLLMLLIFPFALLVLSLHMGRRGIVIMSIILCLFMDPSKVLWYLLLLLLLILLIITIIAITLSVRILLSLYDTKNSSDRNYKGLEALNQFRACGNPFGTASVEITRTGTSVLSMQKHLLEKARKVHYNIRREGNPSNTASAITLIAAVIYRGLSIALGHAILFRFMARYSFDKSLKSYQRDWRRQEELLLNVESSISRTVDELSNIHRSFTVLSCRYWSWCKSRIDAAAGEENGVMEPMTDGEEVFEEIKDLLQQVDNFMQEYVEARAEILKMISMN